MGIGAPLLFVFLWSTGYVVSAYVAPYSEPLSILTLRFCAAALLLSLFGVILRGTWPNRSRTIKIIISGTLIHGGYLSCVFWGIKNGMPAGISALLIGLQPILTAILAAPLLGEKTYLRHWVGLIVGLIGCGIVLSPKFTFDGIGITPVTVGIHLVAVLSIVLGSIFQKRYVGAMNFKTEPGLQLIGGALVAAPIAFATESFAFTFAPQLFIGYAWMTLVLSCISFTLYMYLLQQGEASKVSSVFYLVPGVAAIQGYFLLNETLTIFQLIGMIITTAAVALSSDLLIKKSNQ